MASAPILDLETLTRPIAGDNPVGEDLRADSSPTSIYYRLKDARSTARAEERQLTAEGEAGTIPDQWRVLLDLGPAVLAERTKDLEVAAWMIEALVRYQGFAGLRDGFRLITALAGSFWEGIYPLPDEDGMETRIAPLTGLNGEGADGTLIMPIRQIPLTEPGDQGAMAFWHHEQATALGRVTDDAKREKRIKAGAVTMEQFNTTVQATSPAFFQRLLDDAREATEAFAAMEAKLGEVCGSDGPPTGAIRSAMADVIGLAKFISKDRLPLAPVEVPPEPEPDAAADGAAPAAAARPAAAGSSDAIGSREDAFRLILKAADWFKRNEPHSPIAYTLENLVRRGRMPLRELLQELIPDEGARSQFLSLAGIRLQEGGD